MPKCKVHLSGWANEVILRKCLNFKVILHSFMSVYLWFSYYSDILIYEWEQDKLKQWVASSLRLHCIFAMCRFVWLIQHVVPLCLMLSWVYTVAVLVQRVVYEKEQRLKEVGVFNVKNTKKGSQVIWRFIMNL